MAHYDYKVIPAPTKGTKSPGRKTAEGRFAATIESTLNAEAAEGWEYLRTDILPSDERQGLTGSQTVYRSLMVFRRAKAGSDTTAEDVIQTAQDAADAATPEAAQPQMRRREPTLAPVQPSRGDPAPAPDVPDAPGPDAPGPESPDAPETPKNPDTPDTPDTPKRD